MNILYLPTDLCLLILDFLTNSDPIQIFKFPLLWIKNINKKDFNKIVYEKVLNSSYSNKEFLHSLYLDGTIKNFMVWYSCNNHLFNAIDNLRIFNRIEFFLSIDEPEIIEWLFQNHENTKNKCISKIWNDAIKMNKLHILKIFHKYTTLKKWNDSGYEYAIKNNHLEILEWMLNQNYISLMDVKYRSDCVLFAAKYCNINALKLLKKYGLCDFTYRAFYMVMFSRSEDIYKKEIIEWVKNEIDEKEWNEWNDNIEIRIENLIIFN